MFIDKEACNCTFNLQTLNPCIHTFITITFIILSYQKLIVLAVGFFALNWDIV